MTKTRIDEIPKNGPRHGAPQQESSPGLIQVRLFAGRRKLERAMRELSEGSQVELDAVWICGACAGTETEPPRPKQKRYVRRLPVASGAEGKIRYLKVDEIDWIEAESQYVKLHARSKTFLERGPSMTMSNLSARLDPEQFMRVHRSHIVNLERIVELRTYAPSKRYVMLIGGNEVPVSRSRWDRLQTVMIGCDWR